MTRPWGVIDRTDWRNTPAIQGRVATKVEFEAGRASFYIPEGSKPYPRPLPACAIHHEEGTGKMTPVVIVQAEVLPHMTVLGAVLPDGGSMVCTLPEVEWVPEPDEGFFRVG